MSDLLVQMAKLFTDRKVHVLLAALLPGGRFCRVHWDRFSITRDLDGVATQVRTTTKLYPNDPDVQAYTAIPEEAFNPANQHLAAKYGLIWIRLSDVHPFVAKDDVIGCCWPGTTTLFFRIMSSAVTRQVQRLDGPDENAYTVLMLAVFNHYDSLTETRWAADITRGARDRVNWALTHRASADRNLTMTFGTKSYHPVGDRQALAILGAFGEEDDYERRQKLTGTTVQKAKDGGVPRSERQMPYGFRHARVPGTNRKVRDATRGYLPEADWAFVPAMQAIVTAAVTRDVRGRYTMPMREVTRLLAVADVPRRGQAVDGSYRDLFGDADITDPAAVTAAAVDGMTLYRVGRSFFVNNSYRPRPAADRLAQPDLTLEERLFLQKVILWRTGIFVQKRENDVRGREVAVKGETPIYRDPMDQFGYFLIETRWGFPIDPDTGEELVAWGIPDETWQLLTERLLTERPDAGPRGGRGRARGTRRVLEDFASWTTDSGIEDQPWEWTAGARVNNRRPTAHGDAATAGDSRGRQNVVIYRRSWAEGTAADGSRAGWGKQQSNPKLFVQATINLAELAGDTAARFVEAVESRVLGRCDLAPVVLPAQRAVAEPLEARLGALQRDLAAASKEVADLSRKAEGLRETAFEFKQEGNREKFRTYDRQADERDAEARAADERRMHLEARLAQLRAEVATPAPAEDAVADLSPAAYVAETLRRAALNNGSVPDRAAEYCEERLTGWRFTPAGARVGWSCTARLPLMGGGFVELNLAGSITNIRHKSGRNTVTGDIAAEAVFGQGRDIDEFARIHDVSRATLVKKRLMPWLVDQHMTSPKMKCALVDHPAGAPREVVFAHLTGQPNPAHQRWSQAWRDLVVDSYVRRPRPWGFAACPDDTLQIQRIAATLALPEHRSAGLPLTMLAAVTGRNIKTGLRRLVVPEDREKMNAGFTRPRYFEYVPGSDKQRIRVRPCPHRGCRGVADRVLLLPEVAASGWGVLCSTCWRAPVAAADVSPQTASRWEQAVFPAGYDLFFTGQAGAKGSVRERTETTIMVAPEPFDLAPAVAA
ncbi:hypothetical protein [Blastococcus sp. SYSU DS0541]